MFCNQFAVNSYLLRLKFLSKKSIIDYMERRFKEARLLKGLKLIDCAEKLGVGKPTLNAWERGAKNPTLENLEAMADLYDVSVDYLLGRIDSDIDLSTPISKEMLPALHGRPVWSNELGWCIVNHINGCLCNISGNVPLADAILYLAPDKFVQSPTPAKPISRNELNAFDEVLVEPISPDQKLRHQLRGYYRVMDGYVENNTGNRFFFDTYGFQWLAFEK